MAVLIKKASINDLAELQQLSRETFSEAFAAQNTAENMAHYLAEAFSLKKLGAELHNPESEFQFALNGEEIIGYLKVNVGQAQTELHDYKALEIERIYVLKAFHGQQVGQLLVEKAVELAKQKNATCLWLGVWEENPRAIRFYEKNGFVPFGSHLFKMGNEAQRDILMKLELKTE
jgi:ribosomal protein S18 acetylase RimI-like enzyme